METGIENYVGEWDDECGHHLSIQKLDDQTTSVSFLSNEQAIARSMVRRQTFNAHDLDLRSLGSFRTRGGALETRQRILTAFEF